MKHRYTYLAGLALAALTVQACAVEPAKPLPGEETPGLDLPGDETPGDETPGDETPGDDTPEELEAGFCGSSVGNGDGIDGGSSGAIGGFPAAKAFCESTCGDSGAHMCTQSEMVMSAQEGLLPQETFLWFAGQPFTTPNGNYVDDCNGWTSSDKGDFGNMWGIFNGESQAAFFNCDPGEITPVEIACCI